MLHDILNSIHSLQDVPSLPIAIKWPNDVYYLPSMGNPASSGGSSAPQKIAGALIHTTWSQDRFNVITGVGLNLSNPHPTTCLNAIIRDSFSQTGQGSASSVSASATPTNAQQGDASSGPGAQEAPQLTQEAVLAHVMNRLDECFQVRVTGSISLIV